MENEIEKIEKMLENHNCEDSDRDSNEECDCIKYVERLAELKSRLTKQRKNDII